jgi:hypothetical protein
MTLKEKCPPNQARLGGQILKGGQMVDKSQKSTYVHILEPLIYKPFPQHFLNFIPLPHGLGKTYLKGIL